MKFLFITFVAALRLSPNPLDSWNIIDKIIGHYGMINNSIQVTYPKGAFSHPILQFHANPLPQANSMTLTYNIFVPQNFTYVLGGKLPGLYSGSPKNCSGGKYSPDCLSFRLMWRQSGKLEVYCYIPSSPTLCSLPNVHCNQDYGISLLRGLSSLKAGCWNPIILHVNIQRGIVCLNGNCMNGLNLPLQLSGIFFSTFFGGHSSKYAPLSNQFLQFSNFTMEQSINYHDEL